MKPIDLESGNEVDNLMVEVLLNGRTDQPARDQFVDAIYHLKSNTERLGYEPTDSVRMDAINRLYDGLKCTLNS
jgi:hypothetical protein